MASGVVASVAACLPDLGAFPEWTPPNEAGVVSTAFTCGNGIIDLLDDGGDAGESCDPGEASVAGCEDCRFVCSGAINDAGHCYFFADPTESYPRALSACQGANAHVVTYASADEAAFVESLVVSSARDGEAPHWIGLTYRDDLGFYAPPSGVLEPGWPSPGQSACPGCFALGVDDAGTFGLSAEADASALNGCLVEQDGGWARADCVPLDAGGRPTLHATVCEREPIGQRIYPCTGVLCTTIPVTVGHKRYVIWPTPVVADQARDLCASASDGGALVMFDSREEREQLVREIVARLPPSPSADGTTTGVEVWVGLSFVDGAWTWDDAMPLVTGSRPLPWGQGEPANSGGRAFLSVVAEQVDTELAHTDEPTVDGGRPPARAFACQIPQ